MCQVIYLDRIITNEYILNVHRRKIIRKKNESIPTSLRLFPEMMRKVHKLGVKERRSRANMLAVLVERGLERTEHGAD